MSTPRIEPEPTGWRLSLDAAIPGDDVVGIGADLQPGTVLAAYRQGIFPMYIPARSIFGEDDGDDDAEFDLAPQDAGPADVLGWWSPDPRGILPLDQLRVSRSLRQSQRKFRVSADTAFSAVIQACAGVPRSGHWITDEFIETYTELHRCGWAHSVEVWSTDHQLVGGLYGIEVGGLFAGESMFHLQRDASKVALMGLVRQLTSRPHPDRLLDVQWQTDHLKSLGAVEVSRKKYVELLGRALVVPPVLDGPQEIELTY